MQHFDFVKEQLAISILMKGFPTVLNEPTPGCEPYILVSDIVDAALKDVENLNARVGDMLIEPGM